MQTTDIVFTQYSDKYLEEAVRLSKAASWPHRAEDWEMVLGLSNGVIGTLNGKVVATAIATPFGPAATVNMVIVDEAMRGRGLGRKVMETAMTTTNPSEWRLVATRDGLPLYEKLGFQPYDEVAQYQGIAHVAGVAGKIELDAENGFGWATIKDAGTLADLDKDATGMERLALLLTLLETGKVLAIKESGKIVAWAGLREFGRGWVAGPVIAREKDEAKRLLTALVSLSEGKFLRVDTTVGTGLGEWLSGFGLAFAGGGICMRKGPAPAPPATHMTFTLASQALG